MSKKENTLDLAKLVDKGVRVKLAGGREGKPLQPHRLADSAGQLIWTRTTECLTLQWKVY